ncbi:MAG: FHA domain-containing protein [Phototrophicaceae bacterium]|jgi:pSer/pThr/pTyr-binding forkhead associated (FHA) protein
MSTNYLPDTHNFDDEQPSASPPPATGELEGDDRVPQEAALEIGHGSNRQRLALDFAIGQLTVGRGEKDQADLINLTPFEGFQQGVSRRHATLSRQPNGIYIEDLDTTNGTRINGFMLRPSKAYRLRNNDEIEFGRLRTVIRFIR